MQGDAGVDRVCRFLAVFATKYERGREEECLTVAEGLMEFLLELARAEERAVRYRVCLLLASIFNNLPGDAEVSAELAERMQAAMLERLKDKVPTVRAQAARALSRLADPGEVRHDVNTSWTVGSHSVMHETILPEAPSLRCAC